MKLVQSVNNIFNQLEYAIEQVSDDEYTQPIEVLSHSSIGQHVRHTLEFFICLRDGLSSEIVNYDQRKRDETIQSSKSVTLSVLGRLLEDFRNVDAPKELILEGSYELKETTDPYQIKTSFERELAYNIEHAIHHMAIIKIGLRALRPDIRLPEGFGVASSTLRYEKSQLN